MTVCAALCRSMSCGQHPVAPVAGAAARPGDESVDVTLTAASLPGGLVDTAQRVSREEGQRHHTLQQVALLVSVLAHANDAVLITEAEPQDLPGPRTVYADAALLHTTGYALEEMIGQTPLLHGPRADRRALDRIRRA
ncbi:hypothetical protein V3W47_19155 [Deinococcus sp. YIM 134068]|uniref:hypothetical protein n=1 Tax=Deinococcus lichenicola TaxID=3118910 RepID=UPI002F94B103